MSRRRFAATSTRLASLRPLRKRLLSPRLRLLRHPALLNLLPNPPWLHRRRTPRLHTLWRMPLPRFIASRLPSPARWSRSRKRRDERLRHIGLLRRPKSPLVAPRPLGRSRPLRPRATAEFQARLHRLRRDRPSRRLEPGWARRPPKSWPNREALRPRCTPARVRLRPAHEVRAPLAERPHPRSMRARRRPSCPLRISRSTPG
jgi:hypothetical protein